MVSHQRRYALCQSSLLGSDLIDYMMKILTERGCNFRQIVLERSFPGKIRIYIKSFARDYFSAAMSTPQPDPYNSHDIGVLSGSLSMQGKEMFDKLTAMEKNTNRCKSMAYNVMLDIMNNNFNGLSHQLTTLGCCGDPELNFKLSKIHLKMQETNEESGINYYRTWVDGDIWNKLTYGNQFRLYHEINKGWIWPTFAAMFGVLPVVFQGAKRYKSTKVPAR